MPFFVLIVRKGCVAGERPNFFQTIQKFNVGMSDLVMLLVVPVGKRATFDVAYLLVLDISGEISGQLVSAILSDLLQLFEVSLVQPISETPYSFC